MTDQLPTETDEQALEVRRKRLRFRSWHRGIKEMDLILGHFADRVLWHLTPEEVDEYERLIGLEDTVLYNWVTGREIPLPEYDTPIFRRICELKHMEGTAGRHVD